MKFVITLEEDEYGFIVASCPIIHGRHSQGQDRTEAIANITEVIQAYIESMVKHCEPVLGYFEF